MANRGTPLHTTIDVESARSIVTAFSSACGVNCYFSSLTGDALIPSGADATPTSCAYCRTTDQSLECQSIHLYGAYQAEHLGGRYIYLCSNSFAWCTVPVFSGGKLVGSLVCGPALIMEPEDYVAIRSWEGTSTGQPEYIAYLNQLMADVPYKNPHTFGSISALLMAAAVYIGDSSLQMVSSKQGMEQQKHIGETLHFLKHTHAAIRYPLSKERDLLQSIREGDSTTARRLLNELLGYILFCTGGDFSIMRTRSIELMSVLSRAAAEGGADLERILDLNHKFLSESAYLTSIEDWTAWITHVIERYANLVFNIVDIKHKDLIYKAIHYIKRHYMEHISLEDTARHVGFSPTYFSKVFKDEMHCTFNYYLNHFRIDKSKALLLEGGRSVSEVCSRVGFEDQSYFIKVFRKHLGVTPGQYRRRQGRLDATMERDS